MMRVPPAADAAHAHQVVRGKAHQRLPRQFGLADEFGLGQAAHALHPAKGFLNALAHFQAGLVAFLPLGAAINGRVLVFGRDMRSNFESAAAFDKGLAVVTFVGPHGDPLALVGPASQHGQCRFSFGGAAGLGHFHIHYQTVAVLHQDVAHVAQTGFVTLGFFVQPGIGVCGAGVGVVAALLAFEVDLGVAPLRWRAAVVFALEAFVRSPGINQRAVHAEVFVAGESGPASGELDPLEEHSGQVFVEQAFAVGTERGVVPDLVFQVQADKPAVQQVVVDGLHQQPFAADGEQDLQQQGLQQHLGRNRRASACRIHRLKLRTHGRQQGIDHLAQLAQWVFGGNPVFEADVAEHRPLKILCASHLGCRLRLGRSGSHRSCRRPACSGFFQRPARDGLQNPCF
jgi:hypothetical protein